MAEPVNEIRGLASINQFLEAAVDDAESELLTAQPAGARRAVILEQAVDRDLRALERGVTMHTLYQHTARRSKATRDHVERILERGAQVRTLDEFFNRLIVIDRRLAVIPGEVTRRRGGDPRPEPGVLPRRRLRPLLGAGQASTTSAAASDSDIAAEVRQLTVRMLTEGHSDPASAKRVGVSTRTYASYVAALKDEYGVETQVPARVSRWGAGTRSQPPRAD